MLANISPKGFDYYMKEIYLMIAGLGDQVR